MARPVSSASAAIDAASDRALTFAGKPDVSVPPGAEYISDPLEFSVAPLSDVAVTFHLASPPTGETGHPGSRATSYYVHGDFVSAANFTEPQHVDHWYQVSEIDVGSSRMRERWLRSAIRLPTDTVQRRTETIGGRTCWQGDCKARHTRNVGVSNQGIGGNHLLTDGLGPNALARLIAMCWRRQMCGG